MFKSKGGLHANVKLHFLYFIRPLTEKKKIVAVAFIPEYKHDIIVDKASGLRVLHCVFDERNTSGTPITTRGHCHWLEYAYARTDRVCFLAIYVPERVFSWFLCQ